MENKGKDVNEFIANAKIKLLQGETQDLSEIDEVIKKQFKIDIDRLHKILSTIFYINNSIQGVRLDCSWKKLLNITYNFIKTKVMNKQSFTYADIFFEAIENISSLRLDRKRVSANVIPSISAYFKYGNLGENKEAFSAVNLPGKSGFKRSRGVLFEKIKGKTVELDLEQVVESSDLKILNNQLKKKIKNKIKYKILMDTKDETAYMPFAIMTQRMVDGSYQIVISESFYMFLMTTNSGKDYLVHKLKEELYEIYHNIQGPIAKRKNGEVNSMLYSLKGCSHKDIEAFAKITDAWLSEIELDKWKGYYLNQKRRIMKQMKLLAAMYDRIKQFSEIKTSVDSLDTFLAPQKSLPFKDCVSIDDIVRSVVSGICDA